MGNVTLFGLSTIAICDDRSVLLALPNLRSTVEARLFRGTGGGRRRMFKKNLIAGYFPCDTPVPERLLLALELLVCGFSLRFFACVLVKSIRFENVSNKLQQILCCRGVGWHRLIYVNVMRAPTW